MPRQIAWVLAAAVMYGAPSSAATLCEHEAGTAAPAEQRGGKPPDQGPDHRKPEEHRPFKFWKGETKAELGITNPQAAEIEQIFQATMPKLEATKHKLDKLEAILSQTIRDNTADLATVALQVDRQESMRAELYKIRTLMLYRMRAVLSAEQRAKLQARWEADHRKPSDPTVRR